MKKKKKKEVHIFVPRATITYYYYKYNLMIYTQFFTSTESKKKWTFSVPISVFILLGIFFVDFCITVSTRTGGDSLYRSLNNPTHYRHVLLSFLTNQVEVMGKESVPSNRSPIGRTSHGPKDTEDEHMSKSNLKEGKKDIPGTNENGQIKSVLRVPLWG